MQNIRIAIENYVKCKNKNNKNTTNDIRIINNTTVAAATKRKRNVYQRQQQNGTKKNKMLRKLPNDHYALHNCAIIYPCRNIYVFFVVCVWNNLIHVC